MSLRRLLGIRTPLERDLEKRYGPILGTWNVGAFVILDDKGQERKRRQYFGTSDQVHTLHIFDSLLWFHDGDVMSDPYGLEFATMLGIDLAPDITVYTDDEWAAVFAGRLPDEPSKHVVFGLLVAQAKRYKVPLGPRKRKPRRNA